MTQYLFSIGGDIPAPSKDLLGGKGFGLHLMKLLGVNVPPGFILTTDACRDYMLDPAKVMELVKAYIVPTIIEGLTKEFGFMPLVSVRSGAKFSMPGMMDTILNVGLDATNWNDWAAKLNPNCAADSMKRLVEMYGNVVKGVERESLHHESMEKCLKAYTLATGGEEFPLAEEQLLTSIEAVFKSWNNARAISYRKMNGIPDDLGTAVVVQAMVFGNMSDKSCTGVLFTRSPSNGENKIVGEFLVNAQGEDVVAGIRTPDPLTKLQEWNATVADELIDTVTKLETEYKDAQDVEFTVQEGKLFILQTRSAKRTAQAAVKIAMDLFKAGLISMDEALSRVSLRQFLGASRPSIPAKWKAVNKPNGHGISASNGCVSGVAAFSSKFAVNCKEPCVLIAKETTPDDIEGMKASVGILTKEGGLTSHAAVVARGMDKVCVVGCTSLEKSALHWMLNGEVIKEGVTKVTIDGSTGEVWIGVEAPVEGGANNPDVAEFVSLLEDRWGIWRTVTTPEEMKGAHKMLVATYLIDRIHRGAAVKTRMAALLDAVGEREAVFDLRTVQDMTREADAPVEFLWGDLNHGGSAVAEKLSAIKSAVEGGKINKPNWYVLEAGLTVKQVMDLMGCGIKIVPTVRKIETLKNVEGMCMPDFEAMIAESGKQAIMELVTKKREAGQAIKSFNIVEIVKPEVLPRGMAFALSSVEAAQSLLKGDAA